MTLNEWKQGLPMCWKTWKIKGNAVNYLEKTPKSQAKPLEGWSNMSIRSTLSTKITVTNRFPELDSVKGIISLLTLRYTCWNERDTQRIKALKVPRQTRSIILYWPHKKIELVWPTNDWERSFCTSWTGPGWARMIFSDPSYPNSRDLTILSSKW